MNCACECGQTFPAKDDEIVTAALDILEKQGLPQVTGDWLVRLANGLAMAGGEKGATGHLDKPYTREQAVFVRTIVKQLDTYGPVMLVPLGGNQ